MRVKKESLKFLYGVFAVFAFLIIVGQPETVKAAENSPYYVKVNRQQNVVTVYEKDENGEYTVPVKAMTCSTGVNNATPEGTFTLSMKYRWHELDGKVYGQYCSRITGHILFHSVYYSDTDPSTLSYNGYNKLGTQASHGCVRLSVEDAKWIYDNCPSGTTVTIYDDKENPGPLGKPSTIQIDTSSPCRGWDPTDPDENNPWRQEDKTVESGSDENDTIEESDTTEESVTTEENITTEESAATEEGITTEESAATEESVITEEVTETVVDVEAPEVETARDTMTVSDVSSREELEKQLKENISATDNGIVLSKENITIEADELVRAVQERRYGLYEVSTYATNIFGNKSDIKVFYVKYINTGQEEEQTGTKERTLLENDTGQTVSAGYIDTSPGQKENEKKQRFYAI